MINYNCLVDIYRMTGNQTSKVYSKVLSNAKVLIMPATTETLVLYADVPAGSLYNVLIEDQINQIKGEDKLIITDIMESKFTLADEFIFKDNGRTRNVLLHNITDGVCIKTK